MKFEFIPETEKEKALLAIFENELEERRERYSLDERIMKLEEMLMKNQASGVLENMTLHTVIEKMEVMWGKEGEPSIDQRLDAFECQLNFNTQSLLDIEQVKQRQRNTETEVRQVHEKISSIEQSLASIRCQLEGLNMARKESDGTMANVIKELWGQKTREGKEESL